ncbi:MAG: hypothetical protein VCD00_11165 [Candidatus Hydrogenedentota bacterium]
MADVCDTSDTVVQGEVVEAEAAYESNGQIRTTYTIEVGEEVLLFTKGYGGGLRFKLIQAA